MSSDINMPYDMEPIQACVRIRFSAVLLRGLGFLACKGDEAQVVLHCVTSRIAGLWYFNHDTNSFSYE
jgi:hypothetical protein